MRGRQTFTELRRNKYSLFSFFFFKNSSLSQQCVRLESISQCFCISARRVISLFFKGSGMELEAVGERKPFLQKKSACVCVHLSPSPRLFIPKSTPDEQ